VKTIRRFGCIAAIIFLEGCGSPDAAVALAQRLDWTTSYAHALLRAAFDQTPVEQDETDRALMREVRDLDRADETLPAEIAKYERARANGTSDAAHREAILRTLDTIGGRYSAVVRTLQPRNTHDVVQRVLSETPEMIKELRDRISSLN
jgi:regulator of sirC expression with transglutaminase-like and TPR domain